MDEELAINQFQFVAKVEPSNLGRQGLDIGL